MSQLVGILVNCCRKAEIIINVKRIKARVKAGGHDVPEEKVVKRYEKSLRNLSKLIRIADHTRVIDNSEEKPHLICEVKNNYVTII